ncbi:hypothetical protein SDC9_102055 [bioreactor metagenome]|uniref:Uncharacterized protein n=1 Tax=bioreactor metagenome TaxID=1076179 RepID=A0A645APR4_9ZZZZ
MEIIDCDHDVDSDGPRAQLSGFTDLAPEGPQVCCLAILIVVGFQQPDAVCGNDPDASVVRNGTGKGGERDADAHAALDDGSGGDQVTDFQCRPGGS